MVLIVSRSNLDLFLPPARLSAIPGGGPAIIGFA